MRCALRPFTRITRYALPIVLMLSVGPASSHAQSYVCHAIRRGESAAAVARRITGDSRNTYLTSFQIMNASSKFIPKSQYDRIRAGWRACVIGSAIVERVSSSADRVKGSDEVIDASGGPGVAEPSSVGEARESTPQVSARAQSFANGGAAIALVDMARTAGLHRLRAIGNLDLTIVWLGAAMVVPWFGWRLLDDYLARRRTASIVMRHFAERFVAEFERPLVRDEAADHPVRSRLRCGARKGRFDILLAPAVGRRYPNLSDHKKNVEYDVARVIDALADEAFLSGPLYMQSGWVVVPFQFKAGPKQAGVTCISSF